MPRIAGPIRRMTVEMRDVELLRANTDRAIQITLPQRSRCRGRPSS
jgi:hypothetical protein